MCALPRGVDVHSAQTLTQSPLSSMQGTSTVEMGPTAVPRVLPGRQSCGTCPPSHGDFWTAIQNRGHLVWPDKECVACELRITFTFKTIEKKSRKIFYNVWKVYETQISVSRNKPSGTQLCPLLSEWLAKPGGFAEPPPGALPGTVTRGNGKHRRLPQRALFPRARPRAQLSRVCRGTGEEAAGPPAEGPDTQLGQSVSETSPEFSKPYSDFFCSSSSCCLLCLQTKHLEDRGAHARSDSRGTSSKSKA